jgi:hypothetical protein
MTTIIKIILAIVMPNFAIALLLKNMIKNAENELEIQTADDLKTYYILSCSIVILPLIAVISLLLFDKLNDFYYFKLLSQSSAAFGIIVSVIYLKKTKYLQIIS